MKNDRVDVMFLKPHKEFAPTKGPVDAEDKIPTCHQRHLKKVASTQDQVDSGKRYSLYRVC